MITKEQYEKLTGIIQNVSEATEKLDIKYEGISHFKKIINEQTESLSKLLVNVNKEIENKGVCDNGLGFIIGTYYGLIASYTITENKSIMQDDSVSPDDRNAFLEFAKMVNDALTPLRDIFADQYLLNSHLDNLQKAVGKSDALGKEEKVIKEDPFEAGMKEFQAEEDEKERARNAGEKHDVFDVDYFHETHLHTNGKLFESDDAVTGRSKFNNDDVKTLSNDGSTEYKALKQSLDSKYNYEDRFKYAWEYLRRKSTEPWHDEGKKRVQAAAKLMADAAIMVLNNADSFEDISKDYIDAIRAEACRNGTFRKVMLGRLKNVILDDDKAKLFAEIKLCDLQCQAIGKDALVTGKMNKDDVTKDGRFKDALKKMDAFAGVVNKVCEIQSKKNYFFTPQADLMNVMDVDGKNVLEQMNRGDLKPAPKPAAPQKQSINL